MLNNPYEDMLYMPHPTSKTHPQLFSQGANDFSHLGEWRLFMHF